LSDSDSDASGEDSVATLIPKSDEEPFVVDDSDEEVLFGDDSPALPPPEEADHHFKPITEEPQQRIVTPQDDPVDFIDLTHDNSDESDTKPCADDVGDDASSDDSLLDPDRPSTFASTRPRPASKRVTLNRSASRSIESPSKERPPTHDNSDESDTKPCADDVGDDASSDDYLLDPDRPSTFASTRPRPSKKKIVPPPENNKLTASGTARKRKHPKAGSWQYEVRQWLIDNVMIADDDKLSWPHRGKKGQKEIIDLMMKTDTSLTERSARTKMSYTLNNYMLKTKWIVVEKTAEEMADDLVVDAQDPTSLPIVLCDDFTIPDPGKCAVFFSIGRHRCCFF
jgi:hypothetical protein